MQVEANAPRIPDKVMEITVTQEHIDTATAIIKHNKSYIPRTCPIALALKASGCHDVSACPTSAYWIDEEDKKHEGQLPEEAQAFIEAYDASQPVRPFAFTIKWVHYTHVLGLPV